MAPRGIEDTSAAVYPVIVGIDGSFAAIRAARWAAAAAERFAAPLQLVHADTGAQRQSAEAVLRSAEDAVCTQFQALHVTSALVDGSADQVLVELGPTARLIVLGTRELPSRSALLDSSTTTMVAALSTCPVVAWRGDAMFPTQLPIVVGVDHDQDSRVAITAAFEFADRLDLRIIAVHAWTTPRPAGDVTLPSIAYWSQVESDARQYLSETLMPWMDHYPSVGVTEVVDSDNPSRALLRCSHHAQLLVVGSRAGGHRTGAPMGSIGLDLLHSATIPIMFCHCVDDDR